MPKIHKIELIGTTITPGAIKHYESEAMVEARNEANLQGYVISYTEIETIIRVNWKVFVLEFTVIVKADWFEQDNKTLVRKYDKEFTYEIKGGE